VLARLGHRPALRTADGDALTGNGRYDRLIVTYGVPRIPARWLPLLRPGGVIVAPLYREQPAGLITRLTVAGDGTASGRFLPAYGDFMPTRQRTAPALATALAVARKGEGVTTTTRLPELTLGTLAGPWQAYTALALGDLRRRVGLRSVGACG
jgi:protein-L-isoaspartate(D-aspartate) O-methyltransferase (PCMT)